MSLSIYDTVKSANKTCLFQDIFYFEKRTILHVTALHSVNPEQLSSPIAYPSSYKHPHGARNN